MEKITAYLENLGYTVLEQGKLGKFCTILKDGMPLGFLLSDLTLQVISGTECGPLQAALSFEKENGELEPVGKGEYLLAQYRQQKLTTFFDLETQKPNFVVYLDGRSVPFDKEEDARYHFATRSGLMPEESAKERTSWLYRLRERIIRYLLQKQSIK